MPDLSRRIPASLQAAARWEHFGEQGDIPVMLVLPDHMREQPAPITLWMHGRTVNKELDPGRYLRWMRAGIGACAVDLPGHGERYDERLQSPAAAWEVLCRMVVEIDLIVDALAERPGVDITRIAIGGMSLGGMAALVRLTQPHSFVAASVEATTGSWTQQRDREMFQNVADADIRALEPLANLDTWREIPFQAIHCRLDEWVRFEGQRAFVRALQQRYANPSLIDFIVYDKTGAPYEHAGFGRHASHAKDAQRAFLSTHLLDTR